MQRLPVMLGVMATTATLVGACGGPRTPVPVVGTAEAVVSLAGEWVGEYQNTSRSRRGSIVFSLTAGRDTAVGDVVMIPAGREEPLRPARETPADQRPRSREWPEVLTISFVRVERDRVLGSLDVYRDPECGCLLSTSFEGRIDGDTITGTFLARSLETGRTQTGWWHVARRPDG